MKITPDEATKFSWDGLTGWAYNEKKPFPHASAACIETTVPHGKTRNTHSDIVYFVAEGTGRFFINNKWISVNKNDVIIVPKDTIYDFEASNNTTLKVFLVHTPAFNPDFDLKLD